MNAASVFSVAATQDRLLEISLVFTATSSNFSLKHFFFFCKADENDSKGIFSVLGNLGRLSSLSDGRRGSCQPKTRRFFIQVAVMSFASALIDLPLSGSARLH